MKTMNDKYKSIMHLPHHVSENRKHMSNYDRAAQFSSFAALTGYEEAVIEAARRTDAKPELAEDEKRVIDGYLQVLRENITARPRIALVYFKPDEKKQGGALISLTGEAARIKKDERLLVLSDGQEIPMDDIVSVEPAFKEGFEFELH